jgi:hypothetical protein
MYIYRQLIPDGSTIFYPSARGAHVLKMVSTQEKAVCQAVCKDKFYYKCAMELFL